MKADPLAYFITFHTYGSWLHGDAQGSVDRTHNLHGEDFAPRNQARSEFEASRMHSMDFVLSARQRWIVDQTIREVATFRSWLVHALHVRTNHVHVVITATQARPERVLIDFKSWCTRRLREAGLIEVSAQVWSRHGSTRYLWKEEHVAERVDYVLNMQGAPLPMVPPSGPRP